MTERACPFCTAARAIAGAALGTTVVVAACGGTTDPLPVDAGPDVVDAAAPHDAGLDVITGFDAPPPDAFVPPDGGVALYGAPPVLRREKLHE